MSYYSTSGLKFYWEISWTGGARCKGTSLIVATRGFLTKSILILDHEVPVGAWDVGHGAAKGAGLEYLAHYLTCFGIYL